MTVRLALADTNDHDFARCGYREVLDDPATRCPERTVYVIVWEKNTQKSVACAEHTAYARATPGLDDTITQVYSAPERWFADGS